MAVDIRSGLLCGGRVPAAPGADLHHLFAELASQCQEIIYGIRQQNTLFQQILLAQGFRKGDPVFLADSWTTKKSSV